MKLIKILRNKKIIMLFFLLSLLPLFWHPGVFKNEVYGMGDYLSPFNTGEYIKMNFFAYDIYYQGGAYYPTQLGHIFDIQPFKLLGNLGISSAGATIILICLCLFISQLSVYRLLRFIFSKEKFKCSTITYLVGTTIYSFSLFFLSLIPPGHIILLINFALFPLIIKLLLEFFGYGVDDRNTPLFKDINFKVLAKIFWVSFLMASAFANPGILYSALFIFGVTILILMLVFKKSFLKTSFKGAIFFVVFLSAQLWWILPMTVGINQTLDTVNSSVGSSISNLKIASKGRSISKTLLGLSSGSTSSFGYVEPNSSTTTSNVTSAVYAFFLVIILVTILTQKINKKLIFFILLLLFSAFITKGLNEPFQNIFLFLYNKVPGFKVFRRPSSKIYFFYILQFAVISSYVLAYLSENRSIFVNKIRPFILISLVTIPLIFFSVRPPASLFTIPEYYDEIKANLTEDGFEQIYILPGITGGGGNSYNETLASYHGVDFIHMELGVSYINKVDSQVSNAVGPAITEKIHDKIVSREDICELTKIYGISHLGLRSELSNTYNLKILELEDLLSSCSAVASIKEFGPKHNGFVIYSLKPECRGSLIYSNTGKLEFKSLNPATHLVKVSNEDINTLVFSRKNHTTWALKKIDENTFDRHENAKINIYPYKMTFPSEFDKEMLVNVFKNDFEKKVDSLNNLNEWVVPSDSADKDYNYYLIYNLGQTYFYIGSLLSVVSIISIYIFSYLSRKNSAV